MKNLSNLGKALNKAEQKSIFGGTPLTRVCDEIIGDLCCHTELVHNGENWEEVTTCTGGVN
nr:hypothetical protein [uncultured Psychroserpens sp.]